jgi:CRP-like cAMP-binding protein
VDDSSLKLAASHMRIVRFPENTYIFRQGEVTKEFYGIIKGRISIRVRKPTFEKTLNKIIRGRKMLEISALSKKNNKFKRFKNSCF